MQKKKLTLNSLKVKSFLTTFEQDATQTLKGGDMDTGGGLESYADLNCDPGGSHTECGPPGGSATGAHCGPPQSHTCPPAYTSPEDGCPHNPPTGFGCFQTDFC